MASITLSIPIELPMPITEFVKWGKQQEATLRRELGDRVSNFRVKGEGKDRVTLLQFDLAVNDASDEEG